MGIAWCRERVEQAQNSKSPVDRILVRCSNVIKPRTPYSHSQGKIVNDFVYKGMRNKNVGITGPVSIHAVPPRSRNRTQKSSDWQTCTFVVPSSEDPSKPPVPPPRKKRKRRVNSAEVLNNQLPELHSPTYVIFSESLLNKKVANLDSAEMNETDVLHPLQKSYYKERTSGYDRFGKLSGNRARKIKRESHPNDMKEENIKNDNEKKAEQKIKHISTVSLPNYNELIKPARKVSTDTENGNDKTGNQSVGLKHPRRNSSTISLPGEGSNSILSSLSEATIHRLETYMKRCRSFGSLKPQQLLEKLEEFNKTHRSASESSDSWSGLDDWDLGVIEYCDSETSQAPPLTPKSTLPAKQGKVSFHPDYTKNKDEREYNKTCLEKENTQKITPSKRSSSRRKIIVRSESIIEGVPLEWFLDPQLRAPAIMPPPDPQTQKINTPPPSPEVNGNDNKEVVTNTEEHSSLLNILRQYKEDESGEPELQISLKELVNVMEQPEKPEMNFEGVDVNITLEDVNPYTPIKDRSASLTEEQIRLLHVERFKARSPSIGFESSTYLLQNLESNKEAIAKEILLKPTELISGLRRESLCQSLPEDAFEAFENKKKPSLRESLNEFLGFEDSKLPTEADDEGFKKASNHELSKDELNEKKECKKDEKENVSLPPPPPPPPPLPSNPPPIVIVPPQKEENTSHSHYLVKSSDDSDVI